MSRYRHKMNLNSHPNRNQSNEFINSTINTEMSDMYNDFLPDDDDDLRVQESDTLELYQIERASSDIRISDYLSSISTNSKKKRKPLKEQFVNTDDVLSIPDHKDNVASLSADVLYMLFDYVDIEDRKKAKLLCNSWYDLLLSKKFLKKECHVIHCHSSEQCSKDVKEIYKFKEIHSLDVHNLFANSIPHKFWTNTVVKENLFHLQLLDCRFTLEQRIQLKCILKIIAKNCENLDSLTLTYWYVVSEGYFEKLFEEFANEGVKFLKLTNIKIQDIVIDYLLDVFKVCPNLKRIRSNVKICAATHDTKIKSRDEFWEELDKFGKQIEECCFSICETGLPSINWKLPNLRKIKFFARILPDDCLISFINQNPQLCEIDLVFFFETHNPIHRALKVLNIALNNCRNLSSFKLTYQRRIREYEALENYSQLYPLFKQKLQTLILPYDFIPNTVTSNSSSELRINNDSLQTLNTVPHIHPIFTSKPPEHLLSFSHFTNLKDLVLRDFEITRNILELIAKKSPHLEKLSCCIQTYITFVTRNPFGRSTFFNQSNINLLENFKNLKYLNFTANITNESYLRTIKLPNLAHLLVICLRLKCDNEVIATRRVRELLVLLTKESTRLKSAIIATDKFVDNSVWMPLAVAAKNLKFLRIERPQDDKYRILNMGSAQMKHFFKKCNSLKLLIVRELRVSNSNNNFCKSTQLQSMAMDYEHFYHFVEMYAYWYNKVTDELYETTDMSNPEECDLFFMPPKCSPYEYKDEM